MGLTLQAARSSPQGRHNHVHGEGPDNFLSPHAKPLQNAGIPDQAPDSPGLLQQHDQHAHQKPGLGVGSQSPQVQ